MASSTHALYNIANAEITYTLVGQTPTSALYRVLTRSLALPLSLEFKYKIGTPGSKGNDKITVILRDTVQNSTTGQISTCSITTTLSLPRDSAYTEAMANDLFANLAHLFATDASLALLVDGVTP